MVLTTHVILYLSYFKIELLWRRAVKDPGHNQIFCLLHGEKLSYKVCDESITKLSALSQGNNGKQLPCTTIVHSPLKFQFSSLGDMQDLFHLIPKVLIFLNKLAYSLISSNMYTVASKRWH